MTPADGGDFGHELAGARVLRDGCAILLQGGRVLLTFVCGERPPAAGHLIHRDSRSRWLAECWQAAGHWYGVAVLDALPMGDAEVVVAGTPHRWRLAATPPLDVAPGPLAEHVRRAGASAREVFGFLVRHLLAECPHDSPEAQSHRGFARAFIAAAASHDGFIEITGTPDTGGYFAQGWSMSLQPGTHVLADASEDLALREVEVAVFERDDILPPGQGFCLFGKFWNEAGATPGPVFFERDDQLLRLDVVRNGLHHLAPDAARDHLLRIAPRLRAPEPTLQAFRRVCRPRFAGADTLSGCPAPIAAACDAVLQAPDGTLLCTGWLLDPLARVERVLLKSSGNLYAPLDTAWCPLPRPDLVTGFSQDPRFAGLLDERDAMHGFIAHVPATRAETDGDVYLELVLDDGSCLFRPLALTPFATAERLPQLLRNLSPAEPELARIIESHLAPFLSSVRPAASLRRRGAAARALPLGDGPGRKPVTALMPFRTLAELQPVLAFLAGTPDAETLDLLLVTPRDKVAEILEKLGEAFAFYGLTGGLAVASGAESHPAQLDLAAEASTSPHLLAWSPSALPKSQGWLARLLDEQAHHPGLLSPALTYEDGSIYFGGATGQPGDWLERGAARPMPAGAAEIALIDRAALARAGGFSGHLFGDAHAHADLAARLRGHGLATWCSGAVEFWMLDDPAPDPTPLERMLRQVDAALLARRTQERAA
ncbi:MAG: hypothetical protein U1E40_14455 [Amaricoccus sp.]